MVHQSGISCNIDREFTLQKRRNGNGNMIVKSTGHMAFFDPEDASLEEDWNVLFKAELKCQPEGSTLNEEHPSARIHCIH